MQVESSAAVSALENLSQFKTETTLKQATYAFIASQLLSKQEKQNLDKVFKAFDKSGDGRLSVDEVREGYQEHYGKAMPEEQLT